ncbi:hypothetical protein VTL71DRAFT_16435 [Oculimacula yallundae]|uniref:BTB domain-containing protein n=1 Tax=Oculimacula yallundae TaxID=86028 RepID=A0ABR4CFA0_9HELO
MSSHISTVGRGRSKNKRKERDVVHELPPQRRKRAMVEGSEPNFSKPTEMVTFRIGCGDDLEVFSVHKEFACHASPVLEAAFNGSYIEGRTQTYELDDVQPAAFRLFLCWVYSQRVSIHSRLAGEFADNNFAGSDGDTDYIDSENEETMSDPNKNLQVDTGRKQVGGKTDIADIGYDEFGFILPDVAEYEQDMNLIQLWILADRLLIPKLQNQIISQLTKMGCDYWSTHWINYLYEHTGSGSPLRSFAIDLCLYTVPDGYIQAYPGDFPPAMLRELSSTAIFQLKDATPEYVNHPRHHMQHLHRKKVDFYLDEAVAGPTRRGLYVELGTSVFDHDGLSDSGFRIDTVDIRIGGAFLLSAAFPLSLSRYNIHLRKPRKPNEMVTFIIGQGDNREEFHVHKEFVCHYSPVIEAGFAGPFVKGKSQTYELDDVRPSVFRLLVMWVYSQEVDCTGRLAGEFADAFEGDDDEEEADPYDNVPGWYNSYSDTYARKPGQRALTNGLSLVMIARNQCMPNSRTGDGFS